MAESGLPTKAMMLAAGLGTRMRPLTEKTPKPLIKVSGKALIDYGLDQLARAGISEAVVNVHYLADQIEAHVQSRKHPQIRISDERDALLETGGGIAKALPLLGQEPFILLNSDSFWVADPYPNLALVSDQWNDETMDGLLMLADMSKSIGISGHGDFKLDEKARLRRLHKDETSALVYTGVALLHPRLFANCPDGAFSLNLLFDKAIADGRLCATLMSGLWLHVGTVEAIADAENALKKYL